MQATRLSVSADESYMCAAVAVKCFNNTDAKEFATRRSHVKSGKALCVFAKCLSFGHFIYTCICLIHVQGFWQTILGIYSRAFDALLSMARDFEAAPFYCCHRLLKYTMDMILLP